MLGAVVYRLSFTATGRFEKRHDPSHTLLEVYEPFLAASSTELVRHDALYQPI
jgi:hypothetical protein